MARLTDAQWEAMRAAHEAHGKSFSELSEVYGVHKSNISRRAKAEGWNQEKTQRLISATVENEKEKIALRNETQQLNPMLREEVQREVFDRLAFELQNNADMQRMRDAALSLVDKAVAMADGADKMDDVKGAIAVVEGASRVVKAQRESVLGKTPDTAIQINNNAPARIERVIVDAH
mgnify:CR=1 FL=1